MVNTQVHETNTARVAGQQSVWRAVDVLFCFDVGTPSLTAAEVAERVGLNRTTAWRYLQTLAATGLVRDLGDGRFALGARTLSLAGAYSSQWAELEAVAGMALVRLRDSVGETAALHLRQGWSRVVVRQVESRHELHRTYRDMGVPLSLLAGAPSLAILAHLPARELEAYLDAHASPRTVADRTGARMTRDGLAAHLAGVRREGFALSRGSRVPEVASVATAVRDRDGQVLGSINVTGPDDRLPDGEVPHIAAEVVRAARWIEHQLSDAAGSASEVAYPPPSSRHHDS